MQTTASAASRRCVAWPTSSSSTPRRSTAAATAPAARARSLTVRAFGPGSEIQEGVEVGARVKVTKPIKVSGGKEKERGERREREG
jgi:hypothetical protein